MNILGWLRWYWLDGPRCSFGIPHRPPPKDQRLIDYANDRLREAGLDRYKVHLTCERCREDTL